MKEQNKFKYKYIRRIMVRDNIYEVTLEELAFEAACIRETSFIDYSETERGEGILMSISAEKDKRILANGHFVSFLTVQRVLYTKVKEGYKRLLVYDPTLGPPEYTNDVKRYGDTARVLVVDRWPVDFVDVIAKKIQEKETLKNKKGQNTDDPFYFFQKSWIWISNLQFSFWS